MFAASVAVSFVAVSLDVVVFVEVRLAADSLEVADKFVNTPFVPFTVVAVRLVICALSN